MTGEPLGPVESVVVAMLVLPLGYQVAGVEAGAFADEWEQGGWITARRVARHGQIPLRSARHHLDRLVEMGRAECDASDDGAPWYRWHPNVSPEVYDGLELVDGQHPTRDRASTF